MILYYYTKLILLTDKSPLIPVTNVAYVQPLKTYKKCKFTLIVGVNYVAATCSFQKKTFGQNV